MANIKQQKKRNRQAIGRTVRNKAVKSELKTRVKSAVKAAQEGADTAGERFAIAIKRLDKAATKGVIHKNQAARRKSRLARKVNAAANAGVVEA